MGVSVYDSLLVTEDVVVLSTPLWEFRREHMEGGLLAGNSITFYSLMGVS